MEQEVTVRSYNEHLVESKNMICSFRNLHFRKDGQIINGVKWRTAKAKELFCYLLHNKNKTVSKNELIEILWNEYSKSKALQNLYIAIYQIKNMLKTLDINVDIINTVSGYELVLNHVKYDVHEWTEVVQNINGITDENYSYYEHIMNMYVADYLKEENYAWKDNKSERLKILYISTMYDLINFLKTRRKYMKAILLSLTLQKHYPYLQNNYILLMDLYDKVGDYYNVEKQYNRLKVTLKEKFNKVPNENIQNWYNEWRNSKAVIS